MWDEDNRGIDYRAELDLSDEQLARLERLPGAAGGEQVSCKMAADAAQAAAEHRVDELSRDVIEAFIDGHERRRLG